jgi:hypothetical protein
VEPPHRHDMLRFRQGLTTEKELHEFNSSIIGNYGYYRSMRKVAS